MKYLLLPTATVVALRRVNVTFIPTLPIVFCVTLKKVDVVSNTIPNPPVFLFVLSKSVFSGVCQHGLHPMKVCYFHVFPSLFYLPNQSVI